MAEDDTKGLVFHIIHGSFVDGYGIRTTVFLKGCPLRCLWCCNPEGQEPYPEIKLVASKCNGCGNCLKVCPYDAISLGSGEENNRVKINREACTNCGKCVEVCFTGALEFFGKYMSVNEVFDIVKKDEQYYKRSGGGVTIGGGEPTFQPAFTYRLLKKCQENGLHTAIDTCGYALDRTGLRIVKEADLLLYDLKGMNAEEHLRNTGVSNEPIFANLEELAATGKPIIIRMPIIPGYNDSTQNIKNIAGFLAKMKSIKRVDLLPYHKYGTVKYVELGKCYKLDIQPPSDEHINAIKSILEGYGLVTQIGG
jgi:pyruvate formate lyase activating enzyme